jgi:hypothetical protein
MEPLWGIGRRHVRRHDKPSTVTDEEGYYQGYLCDASELRQRLLARGFKIVPAWPSGKRAGVC